MDVITVQQARERGLEPRRLRSETKWQRVAHGIYAPAERADAPLTQLAAARMRLPSSAVFSGLTAAWLHGLDTPLTPIEMTIAPGVPISGRAGMRLHRCELDASEIGIARDMPVTSIERTLADVSGSLSLTEAVVVMDAALHKRRTDLKRLRATADALTGRPGVAMFRRVLQHAEPRAESPMETRTRMVIVLGDLPRPEAQVNVLDGRGRVLARVDLFYRDKRLGIEYDGGLHKDQLAADNRRQNLLLGAGVHLLRFTAADVLSHPAAVVAQVRAMLLA